ncbi:MAG: hypothetical protein AABY03_00285 [Nanoarchaeota archaeon]
MAEKYSKKAADAYKKYLEILPEKWEITREEVIKIIGVDEKKYESLMHSNFWEIQIRDRVARVLGIDFGLSALFGEGHSEDYLENARNFIKNKKSRFQNRSLLEMLMDGKDESLLQAFDYVLEVRRL